MADKRGCGECSPIPHEGGSGKCECECHNERGHDVFQTRARKLTGPPTAAEVDEMCDRIAVMAEPIFEKYGWQWGWGEGFGVPDITRISAMLHELFDHLLDPEGNEGPETGCGRFVIRRSYFGGFDVLLELGSWRDSTYKGGVRIDDTWEANDAHV